MFAGDQSASLGFVADVSAIYAECSPCRSTHGQGGCGNAAAGRRRTPATRGRYSREVVICRAKITRGFLRTDAQHHLGIRMSCLYPPNPRILLGMESAEQVRTPSPAPLNPARSGPGWTIQPWHS